MGRRNSTRGRRRSRVKMANFGIVLLLCFFIQSHMRSKHFLVKTEDSPDGLDGPDENPNRQDSRPPPTPRPDPGRWNVITDCAPNSKFYNEKYQKMCLCAPQGNQADCSSNDYWAGKGYNRNADSRPPPTSRPDPGRWNVITDCA